ncbi:MAG: hypothetical protein J7L64_05390 [Acidobacteria bacterium]|nr:hypothetical protein [Acidobacteriota bacterium]
MNKNSKDQDLVDQVMDELEAADWDLTPDSLERIAEKIKPRFDGNLEEALEFVQGLASSMFGDEIEGSGEI